MNRYELMNEFERLKKFDKTEEYYQSILRLQRENDKLHNELECCRSQLVICAQYFDHLGGSDARLREYLTVADDIRLKKLCAPTATTSTRRKLVERRKEVQGRRKVATRRGSSKKTK